MFQHVKTVIRQPRLLKPHRPVFLLSHMRANTSLLGHILGSNPEIAGYYEMHIGYYSWKSLWRQKLLYYRDHDVKPSVKYLFDKVLHDFHYVDMGLMKENNAKIIFSVREPHQTIKSIVAQFRRKRPGHEYGDTDAASQYYIERLDSLRNMAEQSDQFLFYDADDLRESSDDLLEILSGWLELSTPLSKEFDNFHFSGKLDTGDHSGNLEKREIIKKKTDYSDISLNPDLLKMAEDKYNEVKGWLETHSVNHSN